MTIGNTTVSRRTFTMADGPTTFTISNLPRFSEEDLVVRRYVTTTGVTTDLEVGTDYTLTNLFPSNRDATLTLTTALTAEQTLEVSFTTDPVQQAALRQASRNTPEAIEKALDRNTMAIKSIGEEVKRSIKLGPQFDGTVGQVEGEVQRTGSSIVVYDGVDNKLELVHRDAFKGNQSDIPVRLYHFRIKESLTDSQLLSSAQSAFLRIRNRITVTYDDTIRGHLRFGGLTSGRDVWYDANSFIALAPVDAINEGTVAVFTADNIVELEGDSSTGAVTATVDNSTWLGPIRHFVGPTGIQGREGPEGPAGRDGTDGADADTALVSRNAMNIGEIMAEIGGINASIAGNSNRIANTNRGIGETTQDTGSGTIFQRIKTVRDHSSSVRSDLGNKTDSSSARGIGQIAFHRLNKLEGDLGTTSDPDSSGGSAFARISNNVTTISAVSNRVTANQRAIANLPSGGSGGGVDASLVPSPLRVISVNGGVDIFHDETAIPDVLKVAVRNTRGTVIPGAITCDFAGHTIPTKVGNLNINDFNDGGLSSTAGVGTGTETGLHLQISSGVRTSIRSRSQSHGSALFSFYSNGTRMAMFSIIVKTNLSEMIGGTNLSELLTRGLPSLMRNMFTTILGNIRQTHTRVLLLGDDTTIGSGVGVRGTVSFSEEAHNNWIKAEGVTLSFGSSSSTSFSSDREVHIPGYLINPDGSFGVRGNTRITIPTRNGSLGLTYDPSARSLFFGTEGSESSSNFQYILFAVAHIPSYSFAPPVYFAEYTRTTLGLRLRIPGSRVSADTGFDFLGEFSNSPGIAVNLGTSIVKLLTDTNGGLAYVVNSKATVTISSITVQAQNSNFDFRFKVFFPDGRTRFSTSVTVPASRASELRTVNFSTTSFEVESGDTVALLISDTALQPQAFSFRIDFNIPLLGYTDPT